MSMIKTFGLGLLCFSCYVGYSQEINPATLGLIPYPNQVTVGKKYLLLNKLSVADTSDQFGFAKAYLSQLISKAFPKLESTDLGVNSKSTILFQFNHDIIGRESYRLKIGAKQIVIEASNKQGALMGVMSLIQILETHYNYRLNKFEPIEEMNILDSPRYPIRALMLDPARHFLPVSAVKAYMDTMIRYKYNTLQLHLTDDQGWRVEIKKHPKLTYVTNQDFLSKKNTGKNINRGYYTQEELRELVAYASERGIEVIPEIDIPGHTAALLAAYPELRMEEHRDSLFVLGRVDNVMISATSSSTYKFLDDVFQELSEIFPKNTRLHLGGDESAIERNWAKSPEHLSLMTQLSYSQPEQLMNYFFSKVYQLVRKYSFRPMQWCELDNVRMPAERYLMDYPQDVTLVSWRMGLTPKCIELSRKSGHNLLLAPGESAYLDYPQWVNDLPEYNNWGMPITSLERSYNFDLISGISQEDDKHILGIMATLWGEAIPDIQRAYYMTYPRALAIAEVGWTKHLYRDWGRFKTSVFYVLNSLERNGTPHRRPVELYN